MFGLPAAKRDVIYDFFHAATGLECLWEQQNKFRPEGQSYVSMIVSKPLTQENNFVLEPNDADDGTWDYTFQQMFIVTVSVYQYKDSDYDSDYYMNKIIQKTFSRGALDAMKAADVYLRYHKLVGSVDAKLTDRYEQRTIAEFVFGTTDVMTEDLGTIETVDDVEYEQPGD